MQYVIFNMQYAIPEECLNPVFHLSLLEWWQKQVQLGIPPTLDIASLALIPAKLGWVSLSFDSSSRCPPGSLD